MIEQEMEMTQQSREYIWEKMENYKRWRTPLNEAWRRGCSLQQA